VAETEAAELVVLAGADDCDTYADVVLAAVAVAVELAVDAATEALLVVVKPDGPEPPDLPMESMISGYST